MKRLDAKKEFLQAFMNQYEFQETPPEKRRIDEFGYDSLGFPSTILRQSKGNPQAGHEFDEPPAGSPPPVKKRSLWDRWLGR
jgi:hypothetical protein